MRPGRLQWQPGKKISKSRQGRQAQGHARGGDERLSPVREGLPSAFDVDPRRGNTAPREQGVATAVAALRVTRAVSGSDCEELARHARIRAGSPVRSREQVLAPDPRAHPEELPPQNEPFGAAVEPLRPRAVMVGVDREAEADVEQIRFGMTSGPRLAVCKPMAKWNAVGSSSRNACAAPKSSRAGGPANGMTHATGINAAKIANTRARASLCRPAPRSPAPATAVLGFREHRGADTGQSLAAVVGGRGLLQALGVQLQREPEHRHLRLGEARPRSG